MASANSLSLNTCSIQQPQAIAQRIHILLHLTAVVAILYYRFATLLQGQGGVPTLPWALITTAEVIFALIWFLTQAFRWRPVARAVSLQNLPDDKDLPSLDVFICTADPNKEPTIEVMNTVLSAMGLDYPPDKLAVYLSDDGGAPSTLYALKEACSFAKSWLPFCRKYGIKSRCPEWFFSTYGHDEFLFRSDEFQRDEDNMKVEMDFVTSVNKVVEKVLLILVRGRRMGNPSNERVEDVVRNANERTPLNLRHKIVLGISILLALSLIIYTYTGIANRILDKHQLHLKTIDILPMGINLNNTLSLELILGLQVSFGIPNEIKVYPELGTFVLITRVDENHTLHAFCNSTYKISEHKEHIVLNFQSRHSYLQQKQLMNLQQQMLKGQALWISLIGDFKMDVKLARFQVFPHAHKHIYFSCDIAFRATKFFKLKDFKCENSVIPFNL